MFPAGENVSVSSVGVSCLNCSSSSYPPPDLAKVVVLGIVLVLFVIFGVLGNALVILSVVCNRHLRSVTHYFIANLAAADLLLSSAVLPFSATSEALGRWVFGRIFCSAWAAMDVLCCTASILSLCVISIDRCLAVSYPLHYPAMATGRRGLLAVVALWGLSAAISVGPLFGWKQPDPEDETVCQITVEPGYTLFSAFGSFYIPLTIILVMYCRVYMVARRETENLKRSAQGGGVQAGGVMLRIHRGRKSQTAEDEKEEAMSQKRSGFNLTRLRKFTREKKAAKTLGIVVGCFILCWLPFFLVLPIGSIFPSYKPSETIFKITFWLGYFNSCINPIIYPCFSQEFKKAFNNILHGRCRRTAGFHGANSLSGQTREAAPLWSCCRRLSGSCSSVGGTDQTRTARAQSKSLLKMWCLNTRNGTPALQDASSHGSAKVLHFSLSNVRGEPV